MDSAVVVTGLYVYPVKSCAGTALDAAEFGPRGIVHDREFMVVGPDHRFLTQREVARLALIRPTRTADKLMLDAPAMQRFEHLPADDTTRYDVVIWRDILPAIDQGDAVAEWFSDALHTPARLVRFAPDVVRRVDPTYARRATDQVGFADGYPVLLISEESLADLNSRMDTPLPMNRFRPNVVVRGWGTPYGEDTWSEVCIDRMRFDVVKSCARCVTTTTDQTTAERGAEPLATLATYRRVPRGVLFGQNLIHAQAGTISVGDRLTVISPATPS